MERRRQSGLNFGGVNPRAFASNGTKTGMAGNTVGCPHTFTGKSSASISFDIASTVANPVLFQVKVD